MSVLLDLDSRPSLILQVPLPRSQRRGSSQSKDHVQSDKVDVGMTVNELSVFGRLRKVEKL